MTKNPSSVEHLIGGVRTKIQTRASAPSSRRSAAAVVEFGVQNLGYKAPRGI